MTDLGPNASLIGEPGSRARLMTPALVLDLDAMARNIAAMAAYARDHEIALRPHAKTHKSARIARLQVDAGARGICVVTVGEAEAMVNAGIAGVLITSPVVDPLKIERLMALNARAEERTGAGLMVVADNPDNVDALAAAAAAAGRTLTVLVDLDMGTHRTGVPDPDAGLALAQRIAAAERLRFGGIQAYAGHLQHIETYAMWAELDAPLAGRVAELRDKLAVAGLPAPLITGAGTGTHAIDALGGVFNELQVGSYVFTDVDYNRVVLREDAPRPFEPALFVQLTVVSANAKRLATTDGGIKRFAMDGPEPEIMRGAPAGATMRPMSDEHGMVGLPDGAPPLSIGQKIECLTPHCDPTVNLYDHYHVVREDTLIDIWPVDARGAI